MRITEGPLDELILHKKFPEFGAKLQEQQVFKIIRLLAWEGISFTSPNPLVACVIVDENHRLLGYGAHQRLGGHHAEINALHSIASRDEQHKKQLLKNAIVYVSLEPCAHQGRTPSCAKTLTQYPIAELRYGMIDPNPKVSGQGLAILQAAGIKVTESQELFEAAYFYTRPFLVQQRLQRPFYALKAASTLDGTIAQRGDQRHWISNERSRKYAHFLRGIYDGILIGSGTLIADNPSLNIHRDDFQLRHPAKIVLDFTGNGLRWAIRQKNLNLRSHEHPVKILFIGATDIKTPIPEDLIYIKIPAKSPIELLKKMHTVLLDQQIFSVLVEGGAQTHQNIMQAGFVDRFHLFYAPEIWLKGDRIGLFGEGGSLLRSTDKELVVQPLEKVKLSRSQLTILDDNLLWEAEHE